MIRFEVELLETYTNRVIRRVSLEETLSKVLPYWARDNGHLSLQRVLMRGLVVHGLEGRYRLLPACRS